MRTDLTAAFIAAKGADYRRPRQLLIFKFPTAGLVYVSDQALGPADGLTYSYLPLVMDWGTLHGSAGDPRTMDAGEVSQLSLTLWNGGATPFSDYFLTESPENVEVELRQWFADIPAADSRIIGRFVIADPISFDQATSLLKLDLVSITMRYDQPIGDTLAAWTYAHPDDRYQYLPQVFGVAAKVSALRGKVAHTLTMKGSTGIHSGTIYVYEDLNALAIASSGTLQVGAELLTYSSHSQYGFTLSQANVPAAEYLDRTVVSEVISDHTFCLCPGPVASITDVLVDGTPAVAGTYTAYPALNPARIVFSSLPRTVRYMQETRFKAVTFNTYGTDGPGGVALNQSYGRDREDLGTCCVLQAGNATMSSLRTTAVTNMGTIRKIYLIVEFYTSAVLDPDTIWVYVNGVVRGFVVHPATPPAIKGTAADGSHGHTVTVKDEHTREFIPAPESTPADLRTSPMMSETFSIDLTSLWGGDWNAMQNMPVKVYYYRPAAPVYILNCFFDVEYVPTETVYSDQISATVTGLSTAIRPGAVISHLLTTRAGIDAAELDAASFAAVNSRYDALLYRIDGLIPGDLTVRQALAKICRQARCRLFPSGGLLKLALREGHPVTKTAAKALTAANLQARSIAVSRQPASELDNSIQLFYGRDLSIDDGATGDFSASVTRTDSASIARFGTKSDPAGFRFDLIAGATMAGDVADFYLMAGAYPSTFYTFLVYLDCFELEKEDVITLTADFNGLNATRLVIRSVDRIFGSGRTSAINLLRIVAEQINPV